MVFKFLVGIVEAINQFLPSPESRSPGGKVHCVQQYRAAVNLPQMLLVRDADSLDILSYLDVGILFGTLKSCN